MNSGLKVLREICELFLTFPTYLHVLAKHMSVKELAKIGVSHAHTGSRYCRRMVLSEHGNLKNLSESRESRQVHSEVC